MLMGITVVITILVALTAMLIVVLFYKMAVKQKNINILKKQLKNKRLTGGAYKGMGSSSGEPEDADSPASDSRFRPSA